MGVCRTEALHFGWLFYGICVLEIAKWMLVWIRLELLGWRSGWRPMCEPVVAEEEVED